MDDEVVRDYLRLPGIRDDYLRKVSKLAILQEADLAQDVQKQLKAECWTLRKDAFKILVKAMDAGIDISSVKAEARPFRWSLAQLENEPLRSWLCKLKLHCC